MEDAEVIELYHRRDESAISETDRKHGPFCRRVAVNILSSREDAEECVSDTWLAAWNRMPPDRPASLRAFLGRITRNLSVSRFRKNRAAKRYPGMERMLSELDECIPERAAEISADRAALAEVLSRWLDSLPEADRVLFVRRYWYGEPLNALALAEGVPANRLARRMQTLRLHLKTELEKEDLTV